MSPEDRVSLLAMARAAVEATVRGEPLPTPPPDLPVTLTENGAAFVTLRSGGELRGCIGHLHADQPLWKSAQEMAAAAAEHDPRFDPVCPKELSTLTIEISVLTPMRRASPEEVVIGKHGLYLRLGHATGLLLPQVATDWGWDPVEFLRQVCRKANLPFDAYLDPHVELYVFEAEHFQE